MLTKNCNLYMTFKVMKKILLCQATISRTWMPKDKCNYIFLPICSSTCQIFSSKSDSIGKTV